MASASGAAACLGDVEVRIGGAVGLAGLASVSDWIASDTTNFPYAGTEVELVACTEKARELAETGGRPNGLVAVATTGRYQLP